MLCLLYWWCFISSFLFRFIIIFSEEEEDSSRRSTTAWCKQRHECYVHCQFLRFIFLIYFFKIERFVRFHCPSSIIFVGSICLYFTLNILNIFGRSRSCICNRALPDITSGPEVRQIFKIRTVRKPDVFLPGRSGCK